MLFRDDQYGDNYILLVIELLNFSLQFIFAFVFIFLASYIPIINLSPNFLTKPKFSMIYFKNQVPLSFTIHFIMPFGDLFYPVTI